MTKIYVYCIIDKRKQGPCRIELYFSNLCNVRRSYNRNLNLGKWEAQTQLWLYPIPESTSGIHRAGDFCHCHSSSELLTNPGKHLSVVCTCKQDRSVCRDIVNKLFTMSSWQSCSNEVEEIQQKNEGGKPFQLDLCEMLLPVSVFVYLYICFLLHVICNF